MCFHLYQLDESISNFRIVGWYFQFYSNFKRNFCKQTVENLRRHRVLRRLVWFALFADVPQKRQKDARLIWVNGTNLLRNALTWEKL